MNKPISIVIPTYKEPSALNLCIRSIVEGQENRENQVLVIVDGHYDINKEVLEKWKEHIEILNLEDNIGLPRATNLGFSNSKYDTVLLINDDNVMPYHFDSRVLADYKDGVVLSINHIEPFQSIYPQFYIKDLGRDTESFSLSNFYEEENAISMVYGTKKGGVDNTGSTMPILMSRLDFLRVGGWDSEYPATGVVCDVDFLLKCSMSGLQMKRTYNTHFYHFVSVGTMSNPEDRIRRQQDEQQGWAYADYKWGARIMNDPSTNKKYLAT